MKILQENQTFHNATGSGLFSKLSVGNIVEGGVYIFDFLALISPFLFALPCTSHFSGEEGDGVFAWRLL